MSLARSVALDGPPRLDLDSFGPAARRRLSGPGLRAFLAIADLWGLNELERRILLGLPSRSTYHAWVKAARERRDITLDLDVLMRLSALLGIHKALQILHATEEERLAWLRGPNDSLPFGGQTPLAVMTAGSQDALLIVRRHVDAVRGGLFAAPNAADLDFEPSTDADIIFS